MVTTEREKFTLCLEKTIQKFPKPDGFKGYIYEQGLNAVRTAIVNLPDKEISDLIRDYKLILLGPS